MPLFFLFFTSSVVVVWFYVLIIIKSYEECADSRAMNIVYYLYFTLNLYIVINSCPWKTAETR